MTHINYKHTVWADRIVSIDFQSGAHGNFLEFVCNTMADLVKGTPFNALGAAHNKIKSHGPGFISGHFSYDPSPFLSKKIISIQINADDLLPLQQVSLLRAGDYGIDNNELCINTYHKLNNPHYRWMLDTIIDSFFTNQYKYSYDAVKDATWPDIHTKQDYEKLPEWIKQECKQLHNLTFLELSSNSPDCPRHILREFFKIGFVDLAQNGFLARQNNLSYSDDFDVFVFPFGSFYHAEEFFRCVKQISSWANIPYRNHDRIVTLYEEFLTKQFYKDSKIKCDSIVKQIITNSIDSLPSLDLLEEAYINSKLPQDWFV